MKKKALVVDNDFFFLEFLTELLEERGYHVSKAYDGKEGMEMLRIKDLGIMFVDLVMPKIDGWQLIRYARKKFPSRPFPIVAVSGTIIEQLEDLPGIDADYYVTKGPMEKMKDQINKLVDKIEFQLLPGEEDSALLSIGRIYPRQAAVELLNSLKFQKAVLESLGVGVLVVDRDARIISANTRALELLGRSEETVWNHKVPLLFDGQGRMDVVEALKTIVREPDKKIITAQITMNGGCIRLQVTMLMYEDKGVGWVVAMEELS